MRLRTQLGAGFVLLALCVGGEARADGDTEIDEGVFRLSLPGTWRSLHSSDPGFWPYRRADDLAQVSASIAFAQEALPRSELAGAFEHFVASRRQALEKQAPDCELGAAEPKEHLEALATTYLARCGEGSFKGDVIVVRRDLVASFLLETRSLPEAEFRALLESLRSGLQLSQRE